MTHRHAGLALLTRMIGPIALVVLAVGCGVALEEAGASQQAGIRRTDLQRHDLSVPGREVVQVRVDFAPGAAFGRSSRPTSSRRDSRSS